MFVMQLRLQRTRGKRVPGMIAHPRFRAAYDFLVLRSRVGDEDPGLAEFWTALQAAGPPAVQHPRTAAGPAPAPVTVEAPARRRRRRPRRRKAGSTGS
jgi:poly(A) polymerase